ncbi:flagellar motor switch protein FliM [Alicyclobacillus sp.]|uniref:flagellar motor switch protein FliM n=1 Tax=Alicyclobacillus sp. TaxID=61169 RepID=UPI0025BF786F|nr:flagellar motor switch protein FliM [Alicyclobacillus sp.]MCL6515629.1 flagellar motor switch protein FliM [Alicyclobacillus sp.]
MSEVLSQEEIDALLSALNRGELNADEIREESSGPQVRNYDFRRAMRFSKDHIRILRRIHEHLARLLTTHLSGQLRAVVQVQVETVDQLPYEEFIRSIPPLTVIQLVEMAPLPGKMVLEFNPQVVFAMLDRMMGGFVRGPYRERELTEIELTLVERLFSSLPGFIAEAWRNVEALSPKLLHLESNPQFVQLTTPNETVLVITMSARIGSVSGLVNVCIPHVTLEPVLPRLSTQRFMDSRRSGGWQQEDERRLAKHLMGVAAEVAVELGRARLTMAEVLDLQVGDVIPLQQAIQAPLTVYVNGVPTYTASAGQRNGRYAVKVLTEWREVNDDERPGEVVSGGD